LATVWKPTFLAPHAAPGYPLHPLPLQTAAHDAAVLREQVLELEEQLRAREDEHQEAVRNHTTLFPLPSALPTPTHVNLPDLQVAAMLAGHHQEMKRVQAEMQAERETSASVDDAGLETQLEELNSQLESCQEVGPTLS
jgi:hypothetical protein